MWRVGSQSLELYKSSTNAQKPPKNYHFLYIWNEIKRKNRMRYGGENLKRLQDGILLDSRYSTASMFHPEHTENNTELTT